MPDLPVVWRVGATGLWVCRVGVALALSAAVAGVARVLLWPAADRAGGSLVTLGGVAVAAVFWRTGVHPALEATDSALVVRNPLRTVEISWNEVERATPGYDGILIARRTGSSVTVWAVQKANWSAWRGKRTRADIVAEAVELFARTHGRQGLPASAQHRSVADLAPEPRDAWARPLPFPWRMTRAEALVIGELRHSSSPLVSAAVALLFCALGLITLGLLADNLWNNHVLEERGVVVQATVLDVPGQLKVTWPGLAPRAVFVDPGPSSGSFAIGAVVQVQSDPQEPTLARVVGVPPNTGDRVRQALVGVGALFLGIAYAKWSRWMLVAARAAPPRSSGRHRRS